MSKRLMILGLLALGVGGIPAPTQAVVLPTKYQSTVLVNITGPRVCEPEEIKGGCKDDPHALMGHGSGFIVDKTHVATAKHIGDIKKGQSLVVMDLQGKAHLVIKIELNKKTDFALLTVREPLKATPAKLFCDKVQPFEKLYVVGFPLEFGPMMFEVVASGYYGDANDGTVLLATGVSLPGNSGGPVFNSRGEVVGILIGEYTYGDDVTMSDSDVNIIVPAVSTICERKVS